MLIFSKDKFLKNKRTSRAFILKGIGKVVIETVQLNSTVCIIFPNNLTKTCFLNITQTVFQTSLSVRYTCRTLLKTSSRRVVLTGLGARC